MPEPTRVPVRPIPMKRLVAVAALLVLAGCGSAEQGSADEPKETAEPAQVGSCATDAPTVTDAPVVAKVDLDGDGEADEVKLTGPGGECGNTLFAQVGDGYVSGPLAVGDPLVTSAFAIAPPGRDSQLLVTRAEHPRGGYQLRVYAADGDALTELTVDGQPLVPFVATDVPLGQARVDCTDDGFIVVAGAQRTTYAVDGTHVSTEGPTKTDGELAGQPFASCRP